MRGRIFTLGMIGCLWLSSGSDAGEVPAMNEVVFREGDDAIANPERGFYAPRMSHRMDRLDSLLVAAPVAWLIMYLLVPGG